jgi:hypothetical protein
MSQYHLQEHTFKYENECLSDEKIEEKSGEKWRCCSPTNFRVQNEVPTMEMSSFLNESSMFITISLSGVLRAQNGLPNMETCTKIDRKSEVLPSFEVY